MFMRLSTNRFVDCAGQMTISRKLIDMQRGVAPRMAGYQSKEIARELGVGVDAVNKRPAAKPSWRPNPFAAARQLTAFESLRVPICL
jgi:hypothetical protein